MPLNQLVDFCHQNYNRPDRCDDCPNEDCSNSCTACLNHIHHVGTHDRSYNCPNIVYCYTCKYIYRYSSEIEFLLNCYAVIFRNAPTVRLWSIGCGPATELFGLYNFKTNHQLDFAIEYKGFDLNEIWNPVHAYIYQLDNFQADFYNENIFDYIATTDEQPQIIILNYLLSDILRTNRDSIDEFINNLCILIGQLERCILIVNDINLGRNNNEARYYYNIIEARIAAQPNFKHVRKFHFANSQHFFYPYGIRHENNQVQIIPPPEISEAYSPWLECRSAQLVLIKKP